MTFKIFKSIFFTAVAVLLAAVLLSFGITYNSYDRLVIDELHRECEYVRSGFDEYGESYLLGLDIEGVRITRIMPDGTVVFDSLLGEDLAGAENQAHLPEVKEALASGEGFDVRYSGAPGRRVAYLSERLDDGSIVRVSTEHYSAADMLLNVITPAIILFLLVLLIAFAVATKLSHSIVRPINELDLDNPEGAKIYDELKPVAARLAEQNRKIARQISELRRGEAEFRSITDNMSEGMVVINQHLDILSYNKSAGDILGIGEGTPRNILQRNNSEGFRAAILKALGGENGYDTLSLGDKHYGILVTPVKNGDTASGAVIVIIDDTEKEQRETLRREFTSNISHELKTPLTSISGFAELIRDGIAEGEDARRFAGSVYKEAQRLITLVGDIIRLTQLDGAEMPYDEGGVPLLELAHDVAERLEYLASEEGITLEVSGDEVTVPGNRQIVEEMLYNLVDNGIKYNSRGGHVGVTVKEGENAVRVSVSDDGVGIPKDAEGRVFERFYRVDKSHSKNIGGTGLGLSIVKHGAMYHKAALSLSSELGHGTTVSIEFSK